MIDNPALRSYDGKPLIIGIRPEDFEGHHNRVTTTDAEILARAGSEFSREIYIGFWDEDDVLEAKHSNSGEGGN